MLNSKQRSALRGAANRLETVYYIGKDGLTETLVRGAAEALAARELIKIKVQENCAETARELCEELCRLLEAEPIQVIGRRIVIYKRDMKTDRYKDLI